MQPYFSNTAPAIQLGRVHQLIAAFNAQNAAAFAKFLAVNASWRRGEGTSVEGRDTLVAHLQNFFAAFPDATLTAVNVQAFPPGAILVEWTLEATHLAEWWIPDAGPVPPSVQPIRVLGADLVHFNAAHEIESDEARIDTAALFAGTAKPPGSARLQDFARRYTAAWNSQDPAQVAAFYSPHASLRVNGGAPAVGTDAIAQVVESFMSAFPDLELLLDALHGNGDRAVYLWTLLGTNTGPGGTGKRIRVSGYEVWRIGVEGLIAESRGYFDSRGYQHLLEHGVRS